VEALKNQNVKPFICTLFLALLLLLVNRAWADPQKSAATVMPTQQEVTSILTPVFNHRNFTVFRIAPSPVSGLWEVILQIDAGKTILYIDSSRRYFLGGPIMALQGMRNITEESLRSSGMPKVDPSQIPTDDALVVGNAGAPKRVVVFLSPVCRPCGEMLQIVKQISTERKDVSFFLKLLPEGPADESYWRSETIVARRSLALLEDSLSGDKIPRPAAAVPQVGRTLEIAGRLGIRATPTILLGDGTLVEGVLSREALLGWIDRSSEGRGPGEEGGSAERDRAK
jgi:thiol:disulfide interchange protein DsbC